MKITGIRPTPLQATLPGPMRSRGDVGYREFFHTGSEVQRITAVEVETDAGVSGVTLLPGGAGPWVEGVAAPTLSGCDPRSIRHCRHALLAAARPGGDWSAGRVRGCVNRLEFALWDLLGKSAGLPLFRLLGGADPHVELYAGGGSLCWNPLPLLLEETSALLARGLRALKIKIGHGPEEDAEIITAIRRECGPEVRIMVDANRAYDLSGALKLAPVLTEQAVGWFEEPFVYDDPAPWRALRADSPVPVAGGEGFWEVRQAADALRQGIVDILQCDAGGFGLEALQAIGTMAHEAGARLTPHSCNTAIGFLVACHLQAALPNGHLQEWESFDNPFIHSIWADGPTISEGRLQLPERPGLGVRFDPETLLRYASAAA